MIENKTKEEKLIKKLIPKITEYFKKYETLKKEDLIRFMEFIDLSLWNDKDKESFWKELSKNSNKNNLQKVQLVRNLTEYIHNHNKDLFQPEASLKSSVTEFLEREVKLIGDINSENENMYEFYRLLATIEFSNSQSIPLFLLENIIKEYKFINLNKDSIKEIIEELLKEKATSIKKYDYLEIMEKMNKEYQFKLNDMAQKKIIFTDEELDNPELENFICLQTFINILLKISDSIIICHDKNLNGMKNNEVLNCEYFNRSFHVLINNMKLYFYEIMRIYYEQKQKFDYFACSNISKLTILKQENKDLSEQLKVREQEEEENNNEKLLKAVYEELNLEKNKSENYLKQIEQLKIDLCKKDDQLIQYNNKLVEGNKIQKENEGKINSLIKENQIQKEKYKKIFDQLNSFVFINKEKERKFNESIKKMNLSNNLLHLVNLDKEDIISYINDKDKNFGIIEENNQNLKNKINELEKNIQKSDKEIYNLKNINASLNKKNEMLSKEIEDSKKELEERNEKSFFLSNMIDDKIDKEDYDDLENQLNLEKEKNNNLKKNIDKLNEEICKKEEEIIKNKNKINSQENIIKENIEKITNLNELIEKNNRIHIDLLTKYNSLLSLKEETEKKIYEGIKNLNLNEKYQKFINMEKPELIKNILERDKEISKIFEENNNNKNIIRDLENKNQNNNNELEKNILNINNLKQKVGHLEKEVNKLKNDKKYLENNITNIKRELQNEKNEKEILKSVEKELEKEKNKNYLLTIDNENIKKENLAQNENLVKSKNEIYILEKKIKENEEKMNSILNEKYLLNSNYTDLMNRYNEQLTNSKQKEQQTSEAIKNLNLTGAHLKLANMSKVQLISLIVEKDKYFKILENSKKELNEKFEKMEKEKNKIENELNNLKAKHSTFEKKIELINKENEQLKKEIENNKIEKNNLLLDLQNEQNQKDCYKKDSDELKEANKKVKLLLDDIKNLSKENLEKEEKIMEAQKNLLSLQNKINKLLKEKDEITQNYNELLNKSKKQLEKIKILENKEISEKQLIDNLNLSEIYKNLANKSKSDLISIILNKDKLYNKIEEEKNKFEKEIYNLAQKLSDSENKKNEFENNLSELEAKNNTLNNKNEILNKENHSLKIENEQLMKEKIELNSLIKEEKKLGEKLKNQNDLLNKENLKIAILLNENKKLKEDIIKKDDILTKAKNKLSLEENNLKNKDEKIQNLTNEIEKVKNKNEELLIKYNDLLLNLKIKEKQKDDILKNFDEKYKYLFNIPIEKLIELIIEKDKINMENQEENKNIQNKIKSLIERNQKLEGYLDKSKNLKQKYEKIKNTCLEVTKTCEEIKKEREEYKKKYDKLLESMVKKDKDPKIFKINLLARINTSQLLLKKQITKKSSKIINKSIKKYDYLCIRIEPKILPSLEDNHYDGFTVFTESIKFIDQQNETSSECILFITMEYFYLFNWKYKKCCSIPLLALRMINISKSSNYISLFFERGEIIIFETFRVLELINFFKLLKAQQKSYNYKINIEPYIYSADKKDKNYIQCLYYGKAYFSGYLSKKSEGIFIDKYEERFGVLCEIGLIILESPIGKPKEIINLLFAQISTFNNSEGNNCLAINVGEITHKLAFENENVRKEWESQIILWKNNNSYLT